jgi:thiol-disulfide isomerase/thioredoxin
MQARSHRYLIGLLLMGIVLGSLLAFIQPVEVHAQESAGTQAIVIYFFWGDGCPHCAEAEPFLEGLADANPQIELRDYEVWYNADNQAILQQMAAAFHFEPSAVPTFFIGDSYWVGYNDEIKVQIEAKVNTCLVQGCADAGAGIVPGVALPTPTQPGASPAPTGTAAPSEQVITLPFIGQISLATQSLVVSTALIAFVDGFNPCSLWVLSMLLALTLHTGSRRKIIIIGLVFISVTALIYMLFITGLFSLFTFVSFMGWIQVVIAVVALFFAAVNIKDYFWYKEGLSFTIGNQQKSGIFQKIRKVMDSSQSVWGLVGATILMAAGVSLVEFSCTAGFPVLWTNLLAAQNVQTAEFFLLLLVYMLIYQLDELVIFFIAVFTLKASKLEEKEGRFLKLAGGMLMFSLALVMIFKPALMNSIGSSLLIFGAAFAAALLVLLVHRKVLPAFGIWIGSEKPVKKKSKYRH